MQAETPTNSEVRRIVSPCYGSEDKRRRLQLAEAGQQIIVADEVEEAAEAVIIPQEQAVGAARIIPTKTVPIGRFFAVRHHMTVAEMAEKIEPLALRLAVKLTQSGGEREGRLHLLLEKRASAANEAVDIMLAFPSSGNPRSSGRYRSITTEPFRCSFLLYQGAADGIATAWAELIQSTLEACHQPTGQSRTVFSALAASSDGVSLELQLGIEGGPVAD